MTTNENDKLHAADELFDKLREIWVVLQDQKCGWCKRSLAPWWQENEVLDLHSDDPEHQDIVLVCHSCADELHGLLEDDDDYSAWLRQNFSKGQFNDDGGIPHADTPEGQEWIRKIAARIREDDDTTNS